MRAPRRHPATAALADLRAWKGRWATTTTIAETEHILAVEGWLRKIAKTGPTPRQATQTAAKPAGASKPARSRRPATAGQYAGPAADGGGASPD